MGVHSRHPDELELDVVAPGLRSAFLSTVSLAQAVQKLRSAAPAGSAVAGIDGGIFRLVETLEAELDALGVVLRTGARVGDASRPTGSFSTAARSSRPTASCSPAGFRADRRAQGRRGRELVGPARSADDARHRARHPRRPRAGPGCRAARNRSAGRGRGRRASAPRRSPTPPPSGRGSPPARTRARTSLRLSYDGGRAAASRTRSCGSGQDGCRAAARRADSGIRHPRLRSRRVERPARATCRRGSRTAAFRDGVIVVGEAVAGPARRRHRAGEAASLAICSQTSHNRRVYA